MADLVDVENALAAVLLAAIYPNGTSAPSATGDTTRIYRGWPKPKALDDDLAQKIVNISIYSQPNNEANTTRYPKDWQVVTPPAPALTLTVLNRTVTVGGTIQAGDVATVKVGTAKAYSVSVAGNSTLSSVAAALASLIVADFPGTSATGPVVTVASGSVLLVAVGGQGTSIRELRRQKRGWQITCWCATPAQRDVVGHVVDLAFARIERLTLADNTSARIIYERSPITDKFELEQTYRRDFFYSVEYATVETETDTSITAFTQNISGGISPTDSPAVPNIQ